MKKFKHFLKLVKEQIDITSFGIGTQFEFVVSSSVLTTNGEVKIIPEVVYTVTATSNDDATVTATDESGNEITFDIDSIFDKVMILGAETVIENRGIKTHIKESVSKDGETFTFASGDAISTNDLTYLAGHSNDEDAFVNKVIEDLSQYSSAFASEQNKKDLIAFYQRYITANTSDDKPKLFPSIRPEGVRGPLYSVNEPLSQDYSDLVNFAMTLSYNDFMKKFEEFKSYYNLNLNAPIESTYIEQLNNLAYEFEGEESTKESTTESIETGWNQFVTNDDAISPSLTEMVTTTSEFKTLLENKNAGGVYKIANSRDPKPLDKSAKVKVSVMNQASAIKALAALGLEAKNSENMDDEIEISIKSKEDKVKAIEWLKKNGYGERDGYNDSGLKGMFPKLFESIEDIKQNSIDPYKQLTGDDLKVFLMVESLGETLFNFEFFERWSTIQMIEPIITTIIDQNQNGGTRDFPQDKQFYVFVNNYNGKGYKEIETGINAYSHNQMEFIDAEPSSHGYPASYGKIIYSFDRKNGKIEYDKEFFNIK